jgi:hypothetical protein
MHLREKIPKDHFPDVHEPERKESMMTMHIKFSDLLENTRNSSHHRAYDEILLTQSEDLTDRIVD